MKKYTDKELLYAATLRCAKCQAGVAYPLNHDAALNLRAWICSAVLKGVATDSGHASFPFAFWSIREEGSIRIAKGLTTRPPGTKALTQGHATCPKCGTWWEGQPYEAAELDHHWFSGPCPTCGYAVGASGTYSTRDGKPIETGYKTIVVDV